MGIFDRQGVMLAQGEGHHYPLLSQFAPKKEE